MSEEAFVNFMNTADWWVGESFAALTEDAGHSGQCASTSKLTLESECSDRLSATLDCHCCHPGEPETVSCAFARSDSVKRKPDATVGYGNNY